MKSVLADASDAARNDNACKTAATRKSTIPDAARDTVRNGDACKIAAAIKSTIPDALDAAVDRDLAIFTSGHQRSACCFDQAVPGAVIDGIPLFDRDSFQTFAARKSIRPDARNAIWDGNAC